MPESSFERGREMVNNYNDKTCFIIYLSTSVKYNCGNDKNKLYLGTTKIMLVVYYTSIPRKYVQLKLLPLLGKMSLLRPYS